ERIDLMAVQFLKVVLGYLKRLIHPFTNGNAWHNDDELAPTIVFIQFVHGADVGIGFTSTCFHFYRQVVAEFYTFGAFYLLTLIQVIPFLYVLDILEYLRLRYLNRTISIAYILHDFCLICTTLYNACSS